MEDWRRIDIDALDPESRLTDEQLRLVDTDLVSYDDVLLKSRQVKALLSKGNYSDSLRLALTNPPYHSDIEDTRLFNLSLVLEVLTSVKQAQMSNIVQALDIDQQDILVKYLYKAMSQSQSQIHSGILLAWFEKTIEITGLGPILRYMSDRRLV
ncbi:Arc15p [Ascoidea rubescens DSM 1968]|uniref:Actin-related protein 2/3 complex subunit 5 n=1 Tax=Ascoidea rubescens DSM 1968 TaxID=1344418 RepID=A0A1D2VIR9_9ASCO|nr:ARP2/3 complex 16 kDa subunit (p16-Arc) [Ascoidea rubescens DSM 1968]ODV61387.1 ARP2/3 complex 16 kDa subunit (p16-Arc) [Ascoidea rubescens DSM 1968]